MLGGATIERPPLPSGGDFEIHAMPDGARIRSAHWPSPAPSRRPVLFLGGKRDFIERYGEAYQRLLAAGHPVLTFDWRDQGLSTRTGAGPDLFERMKSDLIRMSAWARERAGAPVALVAHSMGGHVALRALADSAGFASRTERAVLLAPMLGLGGRSLLAPLAWMIAKWQVKRGRGTQYPSGQGPYGPAWRSEAHRNRLTGDRARFERAFAWFDFDENLAAGGATWHWVAAAGASMRALNRPDVLTRIGTKTLFFVGTREIVVDSGRIERAVRLMPNAKLITVPEGRHELLQETDAIQAIIWPPLLDFLK